MSSLTVPVLSIVTGEGGSGGALALGVANEVWMMENSIYSILSPEGFASILWKDSKKAKEAAEIMKLTAADLYELGIIEKVIPEYPVINENNIKLNIFSFYPLQTFLNYGIIILILQQRRCITEQKLCYITSFFV